MVKRTICPQGRGRSTAMEALKSSLAVRVWKVKGRGERMLLKDVVVCQTTNHPSFSVEKVLFELPPSALNSLLQARQTSTSSSHLYLLPLATDIISQSTTCQKRQKPSRLTIHFLDFNISHPSATHNTMTSNISNFNFTIGELSSNNLSKTNPLRRMSLPSRYISPSRNPTNTNQPSKHTKLYFNGSANHPKPSKYISTGPYRTEEYFVTEYLTNRVCEDPLMAFCHNRQNKTRLTSGPRRRSRRNGFIHESMTTAYVS